MLKIRLARTGRHKNPFFRVVLTEHTKPANSGYKTVLGWVDPVNHKQSIDSEKCKEWIEKWAQPSERVAKILYKETNDDFFSKFIVERERTRQPKKQD